RSCALISPLRLLMNDSFVARRSVVNAAKVIKGTAEVIKNTCREAVLRANEEPTKGPCPCIVFQIEIKVATNIDALNPPSPKRKAAQSRNGTGAHARPRF